MSVHHWSIKLFAAAMILFLVTSAQAGTVLLDDTFADGSRAETNLPTESAVYFGIDNNASTPQGSSSVAVGAVSHVLDASSTKMWTHFAPNGSPIVLGVHERLVAMIDFIPRGSLYQQTGRGFRVGLFNDPTTSQVVMDVNDDGGGVGDPWQDSTGYGVNIPLQTTASTAPFDINKRINQNSSLIGSGSAFVSGVGGGTPIAETVGIKYTLTYDIHRTSATQNTITVSLADASGILSSHSVVDNGDTIGLSDSYAGNLSGSDAPWTTFDHLMFRFSANTQAADQIDFTRIKVEHFAVPEPASCMLGLLALCGITAAFRRR